MVSFGVWETTWFIVQEIKGRIIPSWGKQNTFFVLMGFPKVLRILYPSSVIEWRLNDWLMLFVRPTVRGFRWSGITEKTHHRCVVILILLTKGTKVLPMRCQCACQSSNSCCDSVTVQSCCVQSEKEIAKADNSASYATTIKLGEGSYYIRP